MPSVTITISAWWAVAAVASVAWCFLIVRPAWRLIDNRLRSRYRGDRRRYQQWRDRIEPIALTLAGPVVWPFWAVDAFQGWQTRRWRNRRAVEPGGGEDR